MRCRCCNAPIETITPFCPPCFQALANHSHRTRCKLHYRWVSIKPRKGTNV